MVHLASPALLGYGGLHVARFLGIPTVAVFQTDIAGFAQSYGVGMMTNVAWAWNRHLHSRADRTLAPSSATMDDLVSHRIPRVYKWGRGVDVTGFAPSARSAALRAQWSPQGKPVVGFVGRLAPEKHVERLAALAHRDDLQLVVVGDGIDKDKLDKGDRQGNPAGDRQLRPERLAQAHRLVAIVRPVGSVLEQDGEAVGQVRVRVAKPLRHRDYSP